MLAGKTVLLCVSGSIAAYKIAYLASALKKLKADVHVLMTRNATNFINPITFETLTGNKCLVDTFDRNFEFSVEHVSLAKAADVVLVAPASANVIAKLAHGLADDMLTTTVLACTCKKIISPAMNTRMFENPITQDNLKICEHYGMEVISPASGYLACGDTGAGKMPEPEVLLQYILKEVQYEKDLKGKKILVTAGPKGDALEQPIPFRGKRKHKRFIRDASSRAERDAGRRDLVPIHRYLDRHRLTSLKCFSMHIHFAVIVGVIDTFEHKARLVLDALKFRAQLLDELLRLLLQLRSGDTRDPVAHNAADVLIHVQVRNVSLQDLHRAGLYKDRRHIDLISMCVPHGRCECGRIGKRPLAQECLRGVVVLVQTKDDKVYA